MIATSTPDMLAVVATAIGLLVAAALGVLIYKQKSIRQSLELIVAANEGLRAVNEDQERQLSVERAKAKAADERLAVFLDGLADRLVNAVVEAWNRTHAAPASPTTTTTHTTTHQETTTP